MSSPLDPSHIASAKSGVTALLSNIKPDVNAEGRPWVLGLERPDINLKVYYSEVPGSSLLRFKGVCEIKGYAPMYIQEAISDNAERLKWDSNIAALDIHDIRGGTSGVPSTDEGILRVVLLRSATKPVGPISAREFLDVTAICDEKFPGVPKGSVVSGGTGVVDAGRFPEASGYVRGWNTASGWVFEKTETGTTIHYVIHSDLKGWMLSVVVNNALTGSYVTFFSDVQKRLETMNREKK